MKIPVLKKNKIAVLCILIILGIISCFMTYGIFFPSINQTSGNSSSNETSIVRDQKVTDVLYEIQEWNTNYPQWMVLVHLTYDDLSEFPDLEKAMNGVDTNPHAWQNNRRVAAWFDGNESDFLRFHDTLCKNKTPAECFPNTPIYEYHGKYYTISYNEIGYHNLPGCERGNNNCTPL